MLNSELSTYTVSVYELQESGFDFGLDSYTIFDETYRNVLNTAILNFYMFREIGFVNPNVWKFKLQSRLDLIMRNKYNALYKAKQIDFNPLFNVDMTETYTHTIANTGVSNNTGELNSASSSNNNINETSNNNGNSLNLTSQFPSEEMTENDLTANIFVDNANKNVNSDESTSNTTQANTGTDTTSTTNNGTSTNNTNENYTKKIEGSSAGLPFSRAMQQLKDFYDDYQLDQQVIDELKDLFIQIW